MSEFQLREEGGSGCDGDGVVVVVVVEREIGGDEMAL